MKIAAHKLGPNHHRTAHRPKKGSTAADLFIANGVYVDAHATRSGSYSIASSVHVQDEGGRKTTPLPLTDQRPEATAGFQKVSPLYGIHWEAGLFLRTPFTEGCDGVIIKPWPL